jgi:hypothetical protein
MDSNVKPYMIKKTCVGKDFLYWNTTAPTWVLADSNNHILSAYDDEVVPAELLAEIKAHTSTIDVDDFTKYETVWNVDGEIKEKMYFRGVWPVGLYGEIQMPLLTAHVTFWNTIGVFVKVQSIMYSYKHDITFTPFQTKHIFDMLGTDIGGFDPCGIEAEYMKKFCPNLPRPRIQQGAINARPPYIVLITSDLSPKERKGYERRVNYKPSKTCNTATWELTEMPSGSGIKIVIRGIIGDINSV